MDKNTFNKLLQNPNYAPLFSELEKLPVDRLIELLHKLGFKCGSALDLKTGDSVEHRGWINCPQDVANESEGQTQSNSFGTL